MLKQEMPSIPVVGQGDIQGNSLNSIDESGSEEMES
jgi:hypothetical protein